MNRRPMSPVFSAVIVLVLLAAYAVTAWRSLERVRAADGWVVHSYDVKFALGLKLLALQAAESSHRGFLLTGDEKYLKPYRELVPGLDKLHAKLVALTADNKDQQRRLRRFHALVRQKAAEMARVLAQYRSGGQPAALAALRQDVGLQLMERIVVEGQGMFDAEDILLAERRQARDAAVRDLRIRTGMLLLGALILEVGFHVASWLTIRYHRDVAEMLRRERGEERGTGSSENQGGD